ncbi:protein translocase subunit SecD [Sinosporangium siamense]|uniref:Multifunctional fusion protein n=1 Tax=Sinosporangium siamense TaxID=1367973 RepID=A0A919V917_9ACTN|nr:protein translocase subunit SecD [Sinosporangium siamense]GII94831.1 protein translocase subunit SecDF [Sinosporangium siamense]
MSRPRPYLWRALPALAIIVASIAIVFSMSPRLGLDLRGGTQLVFETRDSPTVKANSEATDRTAEVLRRRADGLGVVDPVMVRSGEQRIIVELPGVLDPRKAAEVIGQTAQLTFHQVLGIADAQATPKKGELILPDESGQRLRLGAAGLTGDGVADASAGVDPQSGGGWFVDMNFRTEGDRDWAKLEGTAACAPYGDPQRRVAIVLDNKIISSPQINESVGCNAGTGGPRQIIGNFTPEEAEDLAVLIKGGALPVPVEIIEQRTVGPTLGAAAITASAQAAVIGALLTAVFIIVMYRLLGLLATVALACYALISYAALVAFGATLTLPGLAGFVLAIGMAVDANVLVFERAREEYGAAPAKGLRGSLEKGFRNAWSAVADSNVTTLLAAGLLFVLASGPVRGFGVTLSIGVIASLVSAMLITRVLATWALDRRLISNRPRITGISSIGRVRAWLTRRAPDLMKRRNLWLGTAALLAVVALSGLFVRGLNFGVEFTGGRVMEFATTKTVGADVARQAVADAGFPSAVVQSSGDGISVRTGQIGNDEVVKIGEALSGLGAGDAVKQRDELIGPSLGEELRRNALIALGVALAAQLLYLAFRFRWSFGTAAVLALSVDVAAVVGVFAWLGKPIDGVFLAAMLTVIGYSVNDKVVVFDRVRELWAGQPKAPLAGIANSAILQTVPRTISTGLGALFILAALAALGGDSLTDFAVALLIGIITGTFSSAFVAAPLAIGLERFSTTPPPRPKAKRTGRPREGSGAVV